MSRSKVAIIVPWRDKGDAWRASNLRAVLAHLNGLRLAPIHVTGDGRTGPTLPFNRSAAYNLGRARADAVQSPTVYIFHEADMLITEFALREAVKRAEAEPGLVVPFDTYHYLSQADTVAVQRGLTSASVAAPDSRTFTPERVMTDGRSVGAVNVVSAESMRQVGCWDEAFEGWGYDDRAMARAFEVACDAPTRFVPGVGVHLWHKPGWAGGQGFAGGGDVSEEEQAATTANKRRYVRYLNASSPRRIRALTTGKA